MGQVQEAEREQWHHDMDLSSHVPSLQARERGLAKFLAFLR